MTATSVNGLAVVEDQPAHAQIKDRNGAPVPFRQIRELLLADGSVVFGCLHCDNTYATTVSVRSHLKKHAPQLAGTPRAKGPKELTVSDLLSAAETIQKLIADRDAWKARALKAERELTTVRRVLNGAR